MSQKPQEEREDVIHSTLWREEPNAENPFVADACYCSGYDVYGDLLGKASWAEYLYLLFKQEKPTTAQAKLLELVAVALANPGPRDHSVRAAMSAGVGGSLSASCLMAALGPGAGGFGGGREMFLAMENWQQYGTDINAWRAITDSHQTTDLEVWPEIDHYAGFDPYGSKTALTVTQTLHALTQHSEHKHVAWLQSHYSELEAITNMPISILGVCSAAFADLEMSSEQAEMLFLMLRLPGAAAHALEQRSVGHKRYPFFKDGLKLTKQPS